MPDDTRTTSQPNRRERKKLATQLALRKAAVRLVSERGLKNVTVEDITEEADVSVRTFYEHFKSKEAAVVSAGEALESIVLTQLAQRPPHESPIEALYQVLRIRIGLQSESRGQTSYSLIRDNPELEPELLLSFRRLEQALARGVSIRMGVDAEESLQAQLLAGVATLALRVGTQHSVATSTSLLEAVDEAFLHTRLLAASGQLWFEEGQASTSSPSGHGSSPTKEDAHLPTVD